ncbi:cation:proton antiporter [Streptomyces sp. cmx-4-9]|uniref:cation:proton antiporter n=1 Tax=Streptomyces sp. cmx-4-9 TaxID=2790941 RepID=UPI0039811C5F
MPLSDHLLNLPHVAMALAAAVVVVVAGRLVARRTGQPEVIGELAAGLLVGPLLIGLLGRDRFAALLPAHVLKDLGFLAEAGLVLFMVSLVGKLRRGASAPKAGSKAGSNGWVVLGSFLPAFATGLLLAGWVMWAGGADVRGSAPTPSFMLMTAVSLSITAVPVLARILADRGMTDTEAGRTALLSSLVIDAIAWLLLLVAVGLNSGQFSGFLRAVAVLGAAVLTALALRGLLSTRLSSRLCARFPTGTAVLIGAVAIAMAFTMKEQGMTAIIGAVLAGLAVPTRQEALWAPVVDAISRVGLFLMPVFFVVSGVTVLTKGFGTATVTLVVLVLALGVVGKAGGGYLGARIGRHTPFDALRIGVLMNTRGLTELVVLQVGYSAGVLTAPLYLAFVVMALVTTALTGPALRLVDRAEFRSRPPVPGPVMAERGDLR